MSSSFLIAGQFAPLTRGLLTWGDLTRWGGKPSPEPPTPEPTPPSGGMSGGGGAGAIWSEPHPDRVYDRYTKEREFKLRVEKDDKDIIDFIIATTGFY